ncbi:hypothetical protein IWW56_000236 [Coemansia sp. RSA 2131]|nr:hypothetical protein IWW56_000236 [Coemansia sp. RSA 2131]
MVRFGTNAQKSAEPAWQDVGANVLRMDSLYDASFHDWLKCEDNVSIIASYLQRIANEYPMDRIINALRWLVSSWRVESTAVIVRHITAEWAVSPNAKPAASAPFRLDTPQTSSQEPDLAVLAGEARRGLLVRELTKDWTCQQIAQLVGMLSLTFWSERTHLEAFLRTLVSDWDFCRLSSFFSYISSQLGLDYRVKVSMLQQAARRNASRLSLKRSRNSAGRSSAAAAGDNTTVEGEDASNKRMRHEPAEFSTTAGDDESSGPTAAGIVSTDAGESRTETGSHGDSTPLSMATSVVSSAVEHQPSTESMRPATQLPTIAASASATASAAASGPTLPTRAAQSGRLPAPLQTARTAHYTALTTPSSPAASESSHRRLLAMDTAMSEDESDSGELMMTPLSATVAPERYLAQHAQTHVLSPSMHQQRRRPRNGTGRSPTMPTSTSSPLVSTTFNEQPPSSDIVARRPLTPQISSSAYVAHSEVRPQSPTLRRHHRHNRSYQHRDCAQPLTPTHSSASLATLSAANDEAGDHMPSQSSASTSLPSRPTMRLHAASISAGGESQSRLGSNSNPASESGTAEMSQLPSAQADEQPSQDFRARTSSESELGQFDGPPSHLALPLPSESPANAPSLCGRASATAPYDVLGIVMTDSEHHIAGSSA